MLLKDEMFVIMVKFKMNESFVNITFFFFFFSPSPLFGGCAEVGICMGVGFNVFSHLCPCTLPYIRDRNEPG